MTKRKKTSREKKALVGALCTAAVILAGSTFAWFTSQDEVTNRLTASADYGVALTESFNPPENMTPGQEVNKDVSVVNTGNIDALVRLWFGNNLTLSKFDSVALDTSKVTAITSYSKYKNVDEISPADIEAIRTTAKALINADTGHSTYTSLAGKESTSTAYAEEYNRLVEILVDVIKPYYVQSVDLTLNSGKTDVNTDVTRNAMKVAGGVKIPAGTLGTGYSEVTIAEASTAGFYGDVEAYQLKSFDVQAKTSTGGTEAISFAEGGNSENAIVLNKTAYVDEKGVKHADEVTPLQAGGQLVVEANKALSSEEQAVAAGNVGNDFTRYQPKKDGLYLFRRESDGTTSTYVGYYYKAADNDTGGQGKYYAITSTASTSPSDGTTNNTLVIPVTAAPSGAGVVVTSLADIGIKTETTVDNAKYNMRATFGTLTARSSATAESFSTEGNTIVVNYVYNTSTEKAVDTVITGTYTSTTLGTDTIDKINNDSTTKANYNAIEIRYAGKDTTDTDDIVFYIKLADDWSNYWHYEKENVADDIGVGRFYLIDDLEAGEVSHKLIDSVTLSSNTDQKCFSNLEYDINAKIESIQVSYDQNDNETATAANGESWKTANTVEKGLYNTAGTLPASGSGEIVNAYGKEKAYPVSNN